MKKRNTHFGPGILVTAAFIGPGTLTVCTLAGVQSGMTLLWALLLSILITIFIQNIAARISWTSGKGLAEVVHQQTQHVFLRWSLLGLILLAIFLGNAAYEGGNISGAILGIRQFVSLPPYDIGSLTFDILPIIMGVLVGFLLWWGSIRLLKNILISIVLVMSVSFLITAIMTQPDWITFFRGLFLPKVDTENVFLVVAILGTTIVPYNLFLHAALVKKERHLYTDFSELKKDTFISVGFGGLISLCIVIAASASGLESVSSAADLGKAIAPLYGKYAEVLIGIGLFAAGISSAMTAPIAAGYVVSECLGWKGTLGNQRSKVVALVVLAIGVLFASLQIKPIEVIRIAQLANGLLLPVVGLFLFWVLSQKKMQKEYRYFLWVRICLSLIICFFIFLALKTLGLFA